MSFFSRDSAKELVDKIHAARTNNTEIELAMVLIEHGVEEDAGTIIVREVRPASRLSNGWELVHCATVAAGRHLEILFPSPDDHSIEVAEIVFSGGD